MLEPYINPRRHYDGFSLTTAGIYFTRRGGERMKDIACIQINYNREDCMLRLTPSEDPRFKPKWYGSQCYIPTTKLQKHMPKGRYIYTQDLDGGHCYKLEPKVEPLPTNQKSMSEQDHEHKFVNGRCKVCGQME